MWRLLLQFANWQVNKTIDKSNHLILSIDFTINLADRCNKKSETSYNSKLTVNKYHWWLWQQAVIIIFLSVLFVWCRQQDQCNSSDDERESGAPGTVAGKPTRTHAQQKGKTGQGGGYPTAAASRSTAQPSADEQQYTSPIQTSSPRT